MAAAMQPPNATEEEQDATAAATADVVLRAGASGAQILDRVDQVTQVGR